MNKIDLITAVARETGVTRKVADQAVSLVFDSIVQSLASGEKVLIANFGSFDVRERAARKGRNPRTGETVDVPASRSPAFKAGKAFKDAL